MNSINLSSQKYKFLITGGTGFIGSKLCDELLRFSQNVTILTRKNRVPYQNSSINYIQNLNQSDFDYDIVINLCGEPISCRWSEAKKQKIYDSRIKITEELTQKILSAKKSPKLFISGSAVGFYGASDSQIFDEDAMPTKQNLFSKKVCVDWEEKAKPAAKKTRLVLLRTGVVVGKNGGILNKLLPIFKLGLGGRVGLGNQYLSWVHLDDVVGIISYLINNQNISGAVNLTSPNPATNQEFSSTLAKTLKRPCFFNTPAFVLKVVYGEMAEELLLGGQKVLPKKILQAGYKFKFENLDEALKSLF
jgi:uncharacterized protein (TIGR01777 family)